MFTGGDNRDRPAALIDAAGDGRGIADRPRDHPGASTGECGADRCAIRRGQDDPISFTEAEQ